VLGKLVAQKGNSVALWSRHRDLPMRDAVNGVEVIISAVSVKGVQAVAEQLRGIGIPETVILLSATKGLDPTTTCTPSQIWHQMFPHNPVVILSGPNLSKEIVQGLPAATVVAGQDAQAAIAIQRLFASEKFRVYTNTDPLGTELGGTLKNVIAIAVGVCDGLHLGTNAKAALITRALTEIIRIGTHLGGRVETFYGLSGLGDLLATCNSPLSRNYQVGFGLARGFSLEQILGQIEGTAEGVNTAYVLHNIAQRKQISMPISHQVYLLLSEQISPQQAVEALMDRDLKPEV
jgi:glycerol-3-phosphate dehydrogenase (NAD(P)+)